MIPTKLLKYGSLFLITITLSHGIVYNINDVNNRAGSVDDIATYILNSTTHPTFVPIDDTYDELVIFNFTITFNTYSTTNYSYGGFYLVDPAFDSPIAIGNEWGSYNWNAFRSNSNNGVTGNIPIGTNAIVEGQPTTFTMTINYNAGALDTATLRMTGDNTTYDLGAHDYSFDRIRVRNGNDNMMSFTNMSFNVIPEPETYALIFGGLALGFVMLRRRLKA